MERAFIRKKKLAISTLASAYLSIMEKLLNNFFLTIKTKGFYASLIAIKNYIKILIYKNFFSSTLIKKNINISNNPKCLLLQKKDQKISRNERCEATGKKFKQCCGALQ